MGNHIILAQPLMSWSHGDGIVISWLRICAIYLGSCDDNEDDVRDQGDQTYTCRILRKYTNVKLLATSGWLEKIGKPPINVIKKIESPHTLIRWNKYADIKGNWLTLGVLEIRLLWTSHQLDDVTGINRLIKNILSRHVLLDSWIPFCIHYQRSIITLKRPLSGLWLVFLFFRLHGTQFQLYYLTY